MKKVLAWFLAFIITIVAAVYQKKTGPTYPKSEKVIVNNIEYEFSLVRSNGQSDAELLLELPIGVSGDLFYKRYPTNEEWKKTEFVNTTNGVVAYLPKQPPAGKLEYYISLNYENQEIYNNSIDPVVIRFKGDVPAYVLIPHILFMFLAMLLANLAGILALMKESSQRIFAFITIVLLFIGGGILGPIVQKYAFGEYWTGVPFGWDLTDNKTLIALIAWAVAVIGNWKKQRPGLTVFAAVVLLIIFSIPHSLFGSQLNPETGEVIQGYIQNVFLFLN